MPVHASSTRPTLPTSPSDGPPSADSARVPLFLLNGHCGKLAVSRTFTECAGLMRVHAIQYVGMLVPSAAAAKPLGPTALVSSRVWAGLQPIPSLEVAKVSSPIGLLAAQLSNS